MSDKKKGSLSGHITGTEKSAIKDSKQSYYDIDMDYQKSLPIIPILNQLGVSVDNRKRLFCPDPACPDNASRKKGAHITQNNTAHCFVCGGSWNPFTLVGMREFGYTPQECYSAAAIQNIGRCISDDLGYGGATLRTFSKEEKRKDEFQMPAVTLHDMQGNPYTQPLYQCLGLKSNPFRPVQVRSRLGEGQEGDSRQRHQIRLELDRSEAAVLLFTKSLDMLRRANQYLYHTPPELYEEETARDFDTIRIATEAMMKELLPLIHETEQEAVQSALLYTYMTQPDEEFRMRLYHTYQLQLDEAFLYFDMQEGDFITEKEGEQTDEREL